MLSLQTISILLLSLFTNHLYNTYYLQNSSQTPDLRLQSDIDTALSTTAIHNTLASYVHAIDTSNWELLTTEVFIPPVLNPISDNEAQVSYPDFVADYTSFNFGNYSSPVPLAEAIRIALAPVRTQHFIGSIMIQFTKWDDVKRPVEATARYYFQVRHWGLSALPEKKGEEGCYSVWSVYEDLLVRVQGGRDGEVKWRIGERLVTALVSLLGFQ